ncbi:FtsX-like permease family protein [Arthrobacter sp. B1805]|uniref:FtsX-like permease family protein n=1 Tax=Arthrobacter sp. B1805 TaxID=2058892 RepID=UPI000CE49392|nr:FtsX-like permease family protein [Arthrobacter sp. B1805]
MLRLAWSSFTERWPLFIGAILTVTLGVALVQSSLLLLLAAAAQQAPSGADDVTALQLAERSLVAVTVLAVTLAFAAFLAVFIISSTFAFTVAQRRRDLALLRLIGGSHQQVRRLLVSEAFLLGATGTLIGIPAGVGLMHLQAALMARLGFVPESFTGHWHWWILGVSIGVGLGLAVTGVLLAARRAARVAPLEALRETGAATRVMTRGRWIAGTVLVLGSVLLIGLAGVGGPAGGQAMAMLVSVSAAVGFTALSPLLVPFAARLIPARPGAVLAHLAKANLRDSVRRSASTAAPLIVLVGLVLGQSTSLLSFSAAAQEELRNSTSADLVLTSAGPRGLETVDGTDGIAHLSIETSLPISVTTGTGEMAFTEIGRALIIEPERYSRAHPGSTTIGQLPAEAAIAGPGALGTPVGSTVGIRIGDIDLGERTIVDQVPPTIAGGAAVLLDADSVAADLQDSGQTTTFITLEEDAKPSEVVDRLQGFGTVLTFEEWLTSSAAAGTTTSASILLVVMGLGGAYALLAVVNAVVIAAGERRREFAAARATGLTRGQVITMALIESSTVTAIGIGLGVLAAVGTLLAVVTTTTATLGTASISVPWLLTAMLIIGAFLVTALTSAATTITGTRQSPIRLLQSRE